MLYASKAAVASPQKSSAYGNRLKPSSSQNAAYDTAKPTPERPDASDGFDNPKVRMMRELLRRDNIEDDTMK